MKDYNLIIKFNKIIPDEEYQIIINYLDLMIENNDEMIKTIGKNYNRKNKKYDESIEALRDYLYYKTFEIYDWIDWAWNINYQEPKYAKIIKKYEDGTEETLYYCKTIGKRYGFDNHRNMHENKPIFLKCPTCGTPLISFNKNYKYCSDKCRDASKNHRDKECFEMLDESYSYAILTAKKRADYKSEISGKSGKIIAHHLNSYNWDIANRCNPANLIILTEDEHKAFHKKYGYGNNTAEQMEEFIKEYNK